MASVKTITLPDGSSYDFKATYDIEGNNISETYINKNEKGAASGVAPLNSSGTIDEVYLPPSDFVSESGSIVSFDYSKADVPFSSLKVHINPIQLGSGDPSPSNIREIIGYDSASAIVTGKNMIPQLVSGRSVSATTGNNSGTASDGVSVNCATEEFIPVNLNASWYTYGYDSDYSFPATPSSQVFCYDADKNYLGYIVSSTSKARNISMASQHGGGTFDNSEVCYVKIRYFFASGNGHTWTQAMCDGAHFRMNPGDTLNDYVAYEAPDIYTTDFTSAGTVYGGELDVLSGKLTVNMGVLTGSVLSSLNWTRQSGNIAPYFNAAIPSSNDVDGSKRDTVLCNKYKTTTPTYATSDDYVCGFILSGAELRIRDTSYSDVSSFKSSLSDALVVYPLKNAVTYQLTATQVTTLLGQNNVWSDAGEVELTVLPSGVRDYLNSLILVVTQNSSTGELTLS